MSAVEWFCFRFLVEPRDRGAHCPWVTMCLIGEDFADWCDVIINQPGLPERSSSYKLLRVRTVIFCRVKWYSTIF
jgi:hypothetical protein